MDRVDTMVNVPYKWAKKPDIYRYITTAGSEVFVRIYRFVGTVKSSAETND